jgi:SAM-dependent methyltransferase
VPRAADRIHWAVSRLGIDGSERVLELGCGPGVAASLICDQLGRGHLTAVDRSTAMVERARHRNSRHAAAGIVDFVVSPIAEMNLTTSGYDIVFAVDVNVFGTDCGPELHQIRLHMSDRAELHLIHRPPVKAKIQRFIDNLVLALPSNGFAIDDLTVEPIGHDLILGVRARPA